jgi:hypothetical protein
MFMRNNNDEAHHLSEKTTTQIDREGILALRWSMVQGKKHAASGFPDNTGSLGVHKIPRS